MLKSKKAKSGLSLHPSSQANQGPGIIEAGGVEYRLGSVLGTGGFGKVYQGRNERTGDFVAVKQMKIGDVKGDDLDSIMAEIHLLRNLNHQNIVQYVDSCRNETFLHIILEYIENGSLAQIVKSFGTFSEAVATSYIKQVLDGLAYLHAQGVIHRDIKGANILTTKQVRWLCGEQVR